MRIALERSGGFAGLHLRADVDTDVLCPEQARDWEALVRAADLPALAATSPRRGAGGPDRFQYALSLEHDGRRHEVVLGEADLPEQARPLVERLVEWARSRPPG